MTHGFIAVNRHGQVLVSSQTRNLHYVATVQATSMLENGGSVFGGMKQWAYNFYSAHTPVPFFNLTADFTSVIGMLNLGGGSWQVQILRSGTSLTPPVLYIFADLEGRTTTERMGVQVLMDNGVPSFDSRFLPLTVRHTFLAQPPVEPLAAGALSNLQFAPVNETLVTSGVAASNPIASYSSLPQCVRERHLHWEESDDDGQVCLIFKCWKINPRTYYFNQYDWCFYRSGIRLVGSSLYCGWIPVKQGSFYTRLENTTNSLISTITLGIDSGGKSSYGSSGRMPYSNETLNTQPLPVMISDGSFYA
jgi:hypothetical protein